MSRVYIDTCASADVFIVKSKKLLTPVTPSIKKINLTEAGKSMGETHIGTRGNVYNISACPSSRKNIISLMRLRDMGYGVSFMRGPPILVDLDTEEVMLHSSIDNGMLWVPIDALFDLPTKSGTAEISVLTEPEVLLHKRLARTSIRKCIEALRWDLASNDGLRDYHLIKKSKQKKYK